MEIFQCSRQGKIKKLASLEPRLLFEDHPEAAAEARKSQEQPTSGPEQQLGVLAAGAEARKQQLALKGEVKTGETTGEQTPEEEEQIDESGDAILYAQTLKDNPTEFQTMAAILEAGTLLQLVNYQEWPNADPEKMGDLFNKHPDFPVPRGPGRPAFVAGLKAGPPDSSDKSPAADKQRIAYENSRETLVQIVALFDQYFAKKRETTTDVEREINKPPFNETMGNFVRNGIKSFQQGSFLEKGAIIGALITGYILLKELWNTKFVQDHKKGIKIIGTGAFTAFVLTKAASPTKSGPFELMGKYGGIAYLKGINDIKSKEIKQFAQDFKVEDPKGLGTVLLLQKTPVNLLFDEYLRASRPGEKHEIDPIALGFDEYAIDPKYAYETIDGLVRVAGINAGIEKKKAEAKKNKTSYPGFDDVELTEWTSDHNARKAFREKYIDSELGRRQPTLLTAIFNEYQSTDLVNAMGRAKNLPQFAARLAPKKPVSAQKPPTSPEPTPPGTKKKPSSEGSG